MPIVIATESVFPLAETPKHVPPRRGGKRLHQSTPFRWAKHGVRGVRLETIRIAGSLCTSVEALQRFFEALSATDEISPTSAPQSDAQRSSATRRRAKAEAERELDVLLA